MSHKINCYVLMVVSLVTMTEAAILVGSPLPMKEVIVQVDKPKEVEKTQIMDIESCPTTVEELLNTTQVGLCFNEMRSTPSAFADNDPCKWVIFAPENLTQLTLNDDLMSVAQAHAERNAAFQDPTGKFVDALQRFPSQVLSEANQGQAFTSLHVTVQAGPGRGGVFGVVAGWMCVEERREIALSCEFDYMGLGVDFNPVDQLYYVVKYQACSQPVCGC